MLTSRNDLCVRIRSFIESSANGIRRDEERDSLLIELARWQSVHVAAYKKFLAIRDVDASLMQHVDNFPSIATDVFRFVRVAAHASDDDVRVFKTSGTTQGERGTHAFRDLALYDCAARVAAKYALLPDIERISMIILASHENEAPHSSLSYMLNRFVDWFAVDATWVWSNDGLNVSEFDRVLRDAVSRGAPVALLGTSFAFIHAEDSFRDARFALPSGSRIMHTGGTKGRSRAVDAADLCASMTQRYGVPEPSIVSEYGMTEMSSQMYELTLRDAWLGNRASVRRLWVPPWVRASAVDPEHLKPVAQGALGILRFDDMANLDSAWSIQTADLGRVYDDGAVELHGRMQDAVPRGCSLAIEEILETFQ